MRSTIQKLFVLTLLGLLFINAEVLAQQPPPLPPDWDMERTAPVKIKTISVTTLAGDVIAEIPFSEEGTLYALFAELPKGEYHIRRGASTELFIK